MAETLDWKVYEKIVDLDLINMKAFKKLSLPCISQKYPLIAPKSEIFHMKYEPYKSRWQQIIEEIEDANHGSD